MCLPVDSVPLLFVLKANGVKSVNVCNTYISLVVHWKEKCLWMVEEWHCFGLPVVGSHCEHHSDTCLWVWPVLLYLCLVFNDDEA